MIVEFKTEFERIATNKGASFESKAIDELEKHVQNYDFSQALVNLTPIDNYQSNKGSFGFAMYDGQCKIQFLTKASQSNSQESVKDVLIDQMIQLSEDFFDGLNANDAVLANDKRGVFIQPIWEVRNIILRQYTSNFLVGVESDVTFKTGCNRLDYL